jgi:hypothetical protein
MRENIYQNIDQPLNNPLNLAPEPTIPKDRRFLLLLILFSIIILLLVASLIVSRWKITPHKTITTTPSLTPTAIPTIINQPNIIPAVYQPQFKAIEENLKYNSEILPPQIDPQLGL